MKTSLHIPRGYQMSYSTDSVTTSTYYLASGGTPIEVDVSTDTVVGPFDNARDYVITWDGNNPTFTLAESGVYTAAAATTVSGKEDTIVAQTNIPEVTDAGELLSVPNTIAAVNAIIEALVAVGIVVAPAP